MRMRKKLTKGLVGTNISCSLTNSSQVRELIVDQLYVIKEIDTSKMPKEIALE